VFLNLSIIISLFSTQVLAWGPAAHLSFSNHIFDIIHFIPQEIAVLISNFRFDYLYGSIAADIIIGKKFTKYIYNCHNFKIGLKLMNLAETPSQRAFVYGYLSHLAADTIAHNYFIPIQNLKYPKMRIQRHAYWEIRFDQYFKSSIWQLLTKVLEKSSCAINDKLMDSVLKNTIFSFKTNKTIFSKMLTIQKFRKLQKAIQHVNRFSQKNIAANFISECKKMSIAAILDFFINGINSSIYKLDPMGQKILKQSKNLKKSLRIMSKKKSLTKNAYYEHIKNFRDNILKNYFSELISYEFLKKIKPVKLCQ